MKYLNKVFLLFLFIFLVTNISALQIGTKAEFNKNLENSLGTYSIFDSKYLFFEGDKLAEVTLEKNYYSILNGYAEGKTKMYSDGKLFEDLKTYKKDKKSLKELEKLNIFIGINKTKYNKIPIYSDLEKCDLIENYNNSLNKSYKNCYYEIVDYKNEEYYELEWEKYSGELLKGNDSGIEYFWRIEGKRKDTSFGSVDWIATTFGKELKEWALWWNSDWEYKRLINLTANVGNFSYLYQVNYSENMQEDYDDLRFINNAKTEELNFTIQSYNATSAIVRIFSMGESEIYMYYGNPLATSTSSASNTHFNPISYYYLDETSGTTAFDSLGRNNGTNNGATINQVGKINKAYNFDGTNDKIDIPTPHDYDNTSISIWFKTDSLTATQFLISNRPELATQGWQLGYLGATSDKINFAFIGGANIASSTSITSTSNWYHIVITYNGTLAMYINGNLENSSVTTRSTKSDTNLYIGKSNTADYFDGLIDEVGIWNRSLSQSEITALYNYTAPTYTIGEEKMEEEVTTTLNSPADDLNLSYSTINFNATITPTDATIKKVTLYINNEEYLDLYDTNETINYSKILTNLEDGDYTWNITACFIGESTEEDCTESETRTFKVDATLPNITVTSGEGAQNYYYSGINHTVNFTIEDDNLDSGWYSYNGTNKSITPLGSGDNNSIIFSVEEGTYNLTIYANDTFGNVASKEVEWDYLIFEDAIGFNQKTFTTKEENFYLNFTTPTAILPVVYLEYNGTEYLSTRTGTSTNHQISNALIPNTIGNISFRWKITWGTNTVYTPYYTQTVQSVSFLNFTSGNCAAGLTNVMNFIFKDESNQTALTNLNIKYNFEYGITGGTGAYSYGSLNAVTKLALCINTSEAPTYEIGYGEIEYVQTGYTSRRYYLFDRTKLTNVTTNTTLYSLPNGDSTSFLVEIRSPTLQPYVDIYTSLLRWYPDLNEYKIVEMGNTDNKGQTVYKVKIEDVDYRIGIYNKNGSLIYLINPVRMVCLASPCSYTINVPVNTRDYLKETLGFEALITYSDGVFTLTYNDPSQNTELIRFVVTQFSGIDDNPICEINGTSFTGLLTCNVSGYEGTLKAVAYRTASPENPIALKIVEIGETVFQGTFGLFLQFLISITLAFLGIINPMTAIILGLIAMVFGVMVIKTITYPILIAISVLGGIIIYMMRRNT